MFPSTLIKFIKLKLLKEQSGLKGCNKIKTYYILDFFENLGNK